MAVKEIAVVCFLVIFIGKGVLSEGPRQKRCIVIQKQSGSRGDSGEADDDDDYRRPQPKQPPQSDRIKKPQYEDIENIHPELLKYKTPPMKFNSESKLRRRLFRKYLQNLQ